ncbi:MAG: threonine/serine exporter family protein, partial [Afipia sp.]|nr:threonine/serine exporter family protein [Afipia sp.]
MSGLDIALRVLEDSLWSGVAAAGFGMLFNVPRRWLWICMLLGAAGHGTRKLLEFGGFSIEIGTFVGALIVGFAGYAVARRLRAPQTIFT